jgi:hypothetical protein
MGTFVEKSFFAGLKPIEDYPKIVPKKGGTSLAILLQKQNKKQNFRSLITSLHVFKQAALATKCIVHNPNNHLTIV